jgi:serine/threonine-protein kinase
VLYTAHTATFGFDEASLVVQPLPEGAPKVLHRGGYHGRILSSGHLVYLYDGSLFAAPFDLQRLEMLGQPVPVLQGVAAVSRSGGAQFAVSNTGTLAYVPGQSVAASAPISWVSPKAGSSILRAAPADWGGLAFSPDGGQLAMDFSDGKQLDVWIHDLSRDATSRLTFESGSDPVWTPDGRRVVFSSPRGDRSTNNLYWQRADGTGDVLRLTESPNHQTAESWHPSGKFLAYQEQRPRTSNDILILPVEGNDTAGWTPGKPSVFVDSPAGEQRPAFSPDGRWLAYHSNESGVAQVYVRPFPGPGGKWRSRPKAVHRPRGRKPRASSCSSDSTGGSWRCRTGSMASHFVPGGRVSGRRPVWPLGPDSSHLHFIPTAHARRAP